MTTSTATGEFQRRLAAGERDFQGASLSGVNLRGGNLIGTNLRGANLRGANLHGADLRDAKLMRTDLSMADVGMADFGCADLNGADFRGANLKGANFNGALLDGANLRNADLHGGDLRTAKLVRVDLSGPGLLVKADAAVDQLSRDETASSALPEPMEGEGGPSGYVHPEGTPIPPDRLRQIFEPMQQVVQQTNAGTRSVGLGLYIVDSIVTAHQGSVQVESTEATGTTFTVKLPRNAGAPAP